MKRQKMPYVKNNRLWGRSGFRDICQHRGCYDAYPSYHIRQNHAKLPEQSFTCSEKTPDGFVDVRRQGNPHDRYLSAYAPVSTPSFSRILFLGLHPDLEDQPSPAPAIETHIMTGRSLEPQFVGVHPGVEQLVCRGH